MNSLKSWRAGAILVLVGGLLSTLSWSASGHLPLGFSIVGNLASGVGLVLAGVGIRRRYPACWLLMVAGGAWALEGVVFAFGMIAFPPHWMLTTVLVIVAVSTVAASIGTVARARLQGAARWVLILPAIATTATAIAWVTGVAAIFGAFGAVILAGPAVTPLFVGIAWLLVRAERAEPASLAARAQPNVNE